MITARASFGDLPGAVRSLTDPVLSEIETRVRSSARDEIKPWIIAALSAAGLAIMLSLIALRRR